MWHNYKLSILLLLAALFCVSTQAQDARYKRALAIAEGFFAQAEGAQPRRSVRSSEPRVLLPSNSDEPTHYLIAAPDGKGFAVVSGDAVSCPFIGFSDEPLPASIEELPAGMRDYLADIDAQIRRARAKGLSKAPADAASVGNVVVNLGTARWAQGAPFNKLCFTASGRQALTGCIATAFAIVMRHHKWPLRGEGNVYNPNTGEKLELGHTYNWDNMPLEYKNYTEEQADEVAVVMRDLGYAYGLSYGTYSTSGSENAYRMARHFGYVDISQQTGNASGATQRFLVGDERWNELLRASLNDSCPVPYVATNAGSGSDAKHIFIIDGYTDKGYYHFNWGWGGSCNGYFTLAKMDPTSSDDYASKTDSHKAFIGLKPLKITTYTVSVEATEGGTATVNDAQSVTVDSGTEVTLKASPEADYSFTGWFSQDTLVSADTLHTLTVTDNLNFVARFEKNEDTAIEVVTGETNRAEVFDLCGRRVERIERAGIYIVGGKKVIIK